MNLGSGQRSSDTNLCNGSCAHACTHTHTHTHMHVCTHVHTHTHTQTHTYSHTHTHTYIYTYTHTLTHTTHIPIHIHTHMHAHTNTSSNKRIQVCVHMQLRPYKIINNCTDEQHVHELHSTMNTDLQTSLLMNKTWSCTKQQVSIIHRHRDM